MSTSSPQAVVLEGATVSTCGRVPPPKSLCMATAAVPAADGSAISPPSSSTLANSGAAAT